MGAIDQIPCPHSPVLKQPSSASASWPPAWVRGTGTVSVGSRPENIVRLLGERETRGAARRRLRHPCQGAISNVLSAQVPARGPEHVMAADQPAQSIARSSDPHGTRRLRSSAWPWPRRMLARAPSPTISLRESDPATPGRRVGSRLLGTRTSESASRDASVSASSALEIVDCRAPLRGVRASIVDRTGCGVVIAAAREVRAHTRTLLWWFWVVVVGACLTRCSDSQLRLCSRASAARFFRASACPCQH